MLFFGVKMVVYCFVFSSLRLCRAIGVQAEDGSEKMEESTSETGPVYAWISFGRSGSTTIRHVLRERAERKGWRAYSGSQGVCKAKPLRFFSGVPTAVKCKNVEADAVIQTEYHYCDLLGGSRPCKYIAVLRDPVEMMISQYSSFCRDCAEDGKDCVTKALQLSRKEHQLRHPKRLPQLTCPDMSFVDYVRYGGNQILTQFSGKKLFCGRKGHGYNSLAFRECVQTVSDIDFEAALSALQGDDILVLTLDQLWGEDAKPKGLSRLGQLLDEPHFMYRKRLTRNKGHHAYVPTKNETTQIRNLLEYDLRLYSEVSKAHANNSIGKMRHSQPGRLFMRFMRR